MSNRIVIAAILLGAVAAAMVVRDLRDPIEAPPLPALLTRQSSVVAQGHAPTPPQREADKQAPSPDTAANTGAPKDTTPQVAVVAAPSQERAISPDANRAATPTMTDVAVVAVAQNQQPSLKTQTPAQESETTNSKIADTQIADTQIADTKVADRKVAGQSPEVRPSAPQHVAQSRASSVPPVGDIQRTESREQPATLAPAKAAPIAASAIPSLNRNGGAVLSPPIPPRLSKTLRRASADEGAELQPPQAIAQVETPARVADTEAASEARFRRLISFLNKRDSARSDAENAQANSGDERFANRPPSPYGNGGVPAQPASSQSATGLVFAGGAVELKAPWDWRAYEVSAGREVRLAITPGEIRSHDDAIEGLWVACHVQSQAESRPDIAALMNKRLSALLKNAEIRPIEASPLAGKVAYRANYRVAGASGFHVLIPMQWGICEVHARTQDQAALAELNKIIANLIVRDVEKSTPASDERVAASAQILGVWKAFRSKLRLTGDGRIEIEPETKPVRQLGEAEQKPVKVLRGDFEARDDLLFVRWDDGSFLNFRWRLDGDSLLLTDHEGRVSELRMLLE